MTSETADIKIRNVSNDVVGIGNTIVDKINNYFNSECIDNTELTRLKSTVKLNNTIDFNSQPERKREMVIETILNLDNPITEKEIIKTGSVSTFPAMSYQIDGVSFAVGTNYEKHNYSNYSQIHILPSVREITTDMFQNNKMTSTYIFYKPVKLNPGCFPSNINIKTIIFNFSNMNVGDLNSFIEINKDVLVFSEPQKNGKIAIHYNLQNLEIELRKIFNFPYINSGDNPFGGNVNDNPVLRP